MFDDLEFFKSKQLLKEAKIALKERVEYAFSELENLIDQTEYNVVIGDEFKRIYVINNRYIIFIGMMYNKHHSIFDNEKYSSVADDYYLDTRFRLLINKIVWDEKFEIDIKSIIKSFNEKYSSPRVEFYENNQYIERFFNDFRTSPYGDPDRFYMIAEYFKDKIDIYKYLEDNQNSQTIEDNYDFKKLVLYYSKVCNIFEKRIGNYDYKKFDINEYERVYVLEDTLIMYVGAKGACALFNNKNTRLGSVSDRYSIVFQELTYNNLFKSREFNKFIKNIEVVKRKWEVPYNFNNIYYRPFAIGNSEEKILKGYVTKFYNKSNFEYVEKCLPQLNLRKRYDDWEGELRNYIVYEFIYYKNKKGYAVSSTIDPAPRAAARKIFRKYENEYTYLNYYPGIRFDISWEKLFKRFLKDRKDFKVTNKVVGPYSSIFAEKVQYFIVPLYVNNKNIHERIIDKIIENAKNGKYDDKERTLYDISEYKWKSEELMYECVKKVFKNYEVIHQFNPYFLDKQSYDAYVCKKKIAFEYQGKQHFEPIKIFGGEKNFKENQERDKRKLELSKKNGVKLIYINYWEDISVELIKEKLKDLSKK